MVYDTAKVPGVTASHTIVWMTISCGRTRSTVTVALVLTHNTNLNITGTLLYFCWLLLLCRPKSPQARSWSSGESWHLMGTSQFDRSQFWSLHEAQNPCLVRLGYSGICAVKTRLPFDDGDVWSDIRLACELGSRTASKFVCQVEDAHCTGYILAVEMTPPCLVPTCKLKIWIA